MDLDALFRMPMSRLPEEDGADVMECGPVCGSGSRDGLASNGGRAARPGNHLPGGR